MYARFTIAAIIPLYNGEKYIERSLESVFSQTLQPDELIVVDDGSSDSGPKIVEKLVSKEKIKLLRKVNGGQSSARNFGVVNSSSTLIAFLDQDDYWHDNHLYELIKPFSENANLGWAYSNLDEIDEKGGLINRDLLNVVAAQYHPKTSLQQCLSSDMFILPSAALISRKAFISVGMFDVLLSGYEDDDLFLRMFRAGYQNIYVNKALSAWRIYSASSSYSDRMRQSRMTYFHKLIDLFPDDKARGIYWRRDVIAPRFYKSVHLEYRRALSVGALRRAESLAVDLAVIAKHLSRRRNTWKVRLFTILSRNVRLSRTVLSLRDR